MKKCTRCGESKEETKFSKNQYWCKSCQVINNEKYSEYFKEYRKTHPNYKRKYGIGRRTISTYGLKLALEIYDGCDRKCVYCDSEYDLTIHHLDGNGRHNAEKGLPMNNDKNNLVVLCRKCHGSIHGKESKGIKRPRK